MRVLVPVRFDVLGRRMDTPIVTMWSALEAACDLVLWGPGLEGYVPGMTLDEVEAYVDPDVILMPDLHQAIPGLWDQMFAGSERCKAPIAWFFIDHALEVQTRRAAWERLRPAAVISTCAERNLGDYFDLRDRFQTQIFVVPWGFDSVQFHPPAAGAQRDVDVLIIGCADPAWMYPVRRRVRDAARTLAGEFRVLEVSHPGYWDQPDAPAVECVPGRGGALYADLLRRSRIATTGSSFGCAITRKYWETAGCGAIGVGDLPPEPESERFSDGMLVIDPDWEVARIADELRLLLADRDRCERLSAAAVEGVRGCGLEERAHDFVAALERLAKPRPRRPHPFAPAAPLRKICAAAEPDAVPSVRPDWLDIWSFGEPGSSRTRRLALALDGPEDVAVIAFDPDATYDADALVLASACRASGRIAIRSANWALAAVPRAALAEALAGKGGRDGLERAIVELGYEVLEGVAYHDPAAMLLHLMAAPEPGGIRRALALAVAESRTTTAHELAGLAALGGWAAPPPAPVAPLQARPAQDPDCRLLAGARFVRFDPRNLAAIVALARGVSPVQIGVPLICGVRVEDAVAQIAGALAAGGVDPRTCAGLAVLERPLYECEIAWLEAWSAAQSPTAVAGAVA